MNDDDLDPMAQHDVEREIHRLSKELTHNTQQVAELATVAAKADVAYKLANARAWVANRGKGGTVAEKEAAIHVEVAEQYERKMLTEAVYKSAREKGTNLRAQLDALRTIAANVRAVVSGR